MGLGLQRLTARQWAVPPTREPTTVLLIDQAGLVIDDRVTRNRFTTLEHGDMPRVRGIIVHQTGGATAASTLAKYRQVNADGAHFLIDKDGTILQTASIKRQTHHVGKLKARCVLESRCTKEEQVQLGRFNPRAESHRENFKQVPDRFPSNLDAIGIEIVSETVKGPRPNTSVFVPVDSAQNASLTWLGRELEATLNIATTEVFRHPTVSRKNETEASTAKWQ